MIDIKAKKIIENLPPKKNILYLSCYGYETNFYHRIKDCTFTNVVYKDNINNISLEPYDGFVVAFSVFQKPELSIKLIDKIISLKKPVIIVYNSLYYAGYAGFKYLNDKYKIKFKELDCSIIEDAYDDYSIGNVQQSGYAISMKTNVGYGKAFIKNTKNCYIMRFDNVSVIHDVKANYIGPKKERMEQITTTYMNLLKINIPVEKPVWIDRIKILNDDLIKNDVKNLDEEINRLKLEKTKKEIILNENEEYKKVLYTNDEELVDVVQKILLEMLSIPIDDLDRKKQDLYFKLDNTNILVEVKGVNEPFKRENISQVKRHVNDYANEQGIYGEDVNKLCKGLLIINPYRKQELKERIEKEFYSNEVIKDAQYENICTLDTFTLLNYYSKWKNNNNSINLKAIILKNTYNKPDFDEIINL